MVVGEAYSTFDGDFRGEALEEVDGD